VGGADCVGSSISPALKGHPSMNDYSFEVGVRAIVHVEASNPDLARKVVESVLGAPGSQEIELANRNNQGVGRDATVIAVDFVQMTPPKLLADEAKSVATKRRGRRA
jgi:hypothetical protein